MARSAAAAPAGVPPAEKAAPVAEIEAPPPEIWHHQTRGEVWSTPAVDAGVVYAGSDDKRLYALDVDTGAVRWSALLDAAVRSAPSLGSDQLVVSDEAGRVVVLGLDGTRRWQRQVGASTAAVFDGEAVVTVTGEGELVRLDSEGVSWRRPVGPPAGPPAVAGGRIVVASRDGALHGVEGAGGRILWRRELGSGAAGQLVGGTVYAVGGGFLWALRAADGAERWRLSASEFIATPPAVAGDSLLAVAGDGELWAVDAQRGVELWHGHTGAALRAPPVLAGASAFIGSGEHHFLALDLHTGRGRWRFETDATMTRALAVSDGRLIFGSVEGGIYGVAYDLPSARAPSAEEKVQEEKVEVEVGPSFHDGTPALHQRRELGAAGAGVVADGDLLLATTEAGVQAFPSPCEGDATDPRAGDEARWSSPASSPPAVLADGSLVVADGDGIKRLDRQGQELWRAPMQALPGTPTTAAGLVLVGDDAGRVWAFAARDGSRRWRQQVRSPGVPSSVKAAPVTDGTTVAVAVCGGGLAALDFATGRERWRFRDLDCLTASPLIVGDTVYALDAAGTVVAVDLAVGGERWRIGFGGGGRLSPATYFGMLHVAADDGYLHAIDLLRGVEAWRAEVGHRPATSAQIVDGIAYLGSHDGSVYAVNALNGERLWQAHLGSPVRGVSVQACDSVSVHAVTGHGLLATFDLP